MGVAGDLSPQPAWTRLLPADPLPWLLAADEPEARWVALVELLGRPADDREVIATHRAVLGGPRSADLLDRIGDWEAEQRIGGHDSPAYAPNLVHLVLDTGVASADDPRLGRLADQMLAHTDDDGRFAAYAKPRGKGEPCWSALQCDTFAIAGVLARLGRGDDPRLGRALDRIVADAGETTQGFAWRCRPDPVSRFRGPGRKTDYCPMLVVEALRLWSWLPIERRPARLLENARVLLRGWRERATEKPYIFGHGRQFKTVKWPPTWYGAYLVLDAVGRYPELWRGRGPGRGGAEAAAADRRAVAEVAACLVAYNVAADGRVTPLSARQGFGVHSFGQKKAPSPWATARLCAVLRRVEELVDEIAAVDVLALGSSKGGSGAPLPPKVRR